ncbi:MAG: DUF4139 domain-containing protein [Clostridiales bacterium]|nr:DUF4139 domain-containing protein [Clostridiales bacterium]
MDINNSKAVKAVVYQKGAFLTRHVKAELHKGSNTVCIESLSDSIVAETIQIAMSRGLSCSQVVYDPVFKKDKKPNQETAVSKEDKELIRRKVGLQHQMAAARTSFEMLPGKELFRDKKDWESKSLNDFLDFLDFLEKKRVELLNRITDCEEEIREIDSQIKKRSEKENPSSAGMTGVIRMEVEAAEEGEFSFEILYYDREARWEPFYDIQIHGLSEPADIMLKGRIIQNTGEIWENIDLTLSTGNLQQSNNQPELIPWVLRPAVFPAVPPMQAAHARPLYMEAPQAMEETTVLDEATMLLEPNVTEKSGAARNHRKENSYKKNQTSVEYDVAGTVRIESGGKGDIVQILSVEHEAEYVYYVTPKAECSAFLMARIKKRKDYHLIEADANIFLENRYVGATHIGKEDETDEYRISLGRDRDIYVERRKLKQQQSQNLMGNLIRKDFSYQMRVRNRKTERVRVLVKDQIPITTDEKIHVDVVNQSNAYLDEKTGMLSWERDMSGDEEWVINLSFRVSWPKNYSFSM